MQNGHQRIPKANTLDSHPNHPAAKQSCGKFSAPEIAPMRGNDRKLKASAGAARDAWQCGKFAALRTTCSKVFASGANLTEGCFHDMYQKMTHRGGAEGAEKTIFD
jgi:hypothetical protein